MEEFFLLIIVQASFNYNIFALLQNILDQELNLKKTQTNQKTPTPLFYLSLNFKIKIWVSEMDHIQQINVYLSIL